MHVKLPLIFPGRWYMKECTFSLRSPLTHKRKARTKVKSLSLIPPASALSLGRLHGYPVGPSGQNQARGRSLQISFPKLFRHLSLGHLPIPHPTFPHDWEIKARFPGCSSQPEASVPQEKVRVILFLRNSSSAGRMYRIMLLPWRREGAALMRGEGQGRL